MNQMPIDAILEKMKIDKRENVLEKNAVSLVKSLRDDAKQKHQQWKVSGTKFAEKEFQKAYWNWKAIWDLLEKSYGEKYAKSITLKPKCLI